MSDAPLTVQGQISRVRSAGQRASQLAQSGAGLEQQLRQAVTDKISGSPLFAQREEAAQTAITSPTRAREALAQTVQTQPLSPTQQQSILASRQAADVVPLLSLNDLLQAQTGGVGTAVQAGLGSFQSLLNAANQQVGTEQNTLQNLLAQSQREDQARQQQFENALSVQQLNLSRQKAAGGGIQDRLLTLSEASEQGLPVGTRFSDLFGQVPQRQLSSTEIKAQQSQEKVTNVFNRLQETFFGEEGTRDDLGKGRIGGFFSNIAGTLGFNTRVNRFNALRKGAASTLKSAVGETGVLTDQDIERIIGLIPKPTSTPEEAARGFEDISILLNQAQQQAPQTIGRFQVSFE